MGAKQELAKLYTELEEAWLKRREEESRADIPPARIHAYYQLKRNFIQTMAEEQAASRLEGVRQTVQDVRSGILAFRDGASEGKGPGASEEGEGDGPTSDVAIRDLTNQLIQILNQSGSPLATIWKMVNDPSVDWSNDDRDCKKGYVMACFSELVYLRMSRYEVPGRDRYKVIPHSALQLLLEHSIQIDVPQLLRRSTDIASAVGETGQIVFGVFVLPQFTVVAVRGTMPWLNDLLLDFDDRRIQVGGLHYHHGFYSEANDALKDVAAAVPEDRPVYFTGHSLGGALATLLPGLWPGKQKLMTPYVFASPRVGDRKVAESRQIYAYARAADPIPHLPPTASGFCNSGWPVTVIPTGDAWLSGWEIGRHLLKAAKAHKMEQYRKLMAEECDVPYYPAAVYYKRLKELLTD